MKGKYFFNNTTNPRTTIKGLVEYKEDEQEEKKSFHKKSINK